MTIRDPHRQTPHFICQLCLAVLHRSCFGFGALWDCYCAAFVRSGRQQVGGGSGIALFKINPFSCLCLLLWIFDVPALDPIMILNAFLFFSALRFNSQATPHPFKYLGSFFPELYTLYSNFLLSLFFPCMLYTTLNNLHEFNGRGYLAVSRPRRIIAKAIQRKIEFLFLLFVLVVVWLA